ncbi:MAG: hypothetical protein IT435_16160 [Phycisphaerales bacterium]|nr:hypothetical protein [Phycisphaerales bacterium]
MPSQAELANLRSTCSPSRGGGGGGMRLIAGGMSVLMALALAVNLTCRAAGPTLGSGSPEKMPLRQLTLAIHRVVRRLIRSRIQRERPSDEIRTPRYGIARRRWSRVCPVGGAWSSGRLLEGLIDLPPPKFA